MFKVYKNGICVSGIFTRAYTDDPQRAYQWMEDMFHRRFFCPAARHAYELRSPHYIIDMGKSLPQAVTPRPPNDSVSPNDSVYALRIHAQIPSPLPRQP